MARIPRGNIAQPMKHPIIEKLEEMNNEAVLVEGYIGGNETHYRLYHCLNLNDYLEIPKEAVLDIIPVSDEANGRTAVFIKPEQQITSVSINRSSVIAKDIQQPDKTLEMNIGIPGVRYQDLWKKYLPSGGTSDPFEDFEELMKLRALARLMGINIPQ